jgi:hypothetical protein
LELGEPHEERASCPLPPFQPVDAVHVVSPPTRRKGHLKLWLARVKIWFRVKVLIYFNYMRNMVK